PLNLSTQDYFFSIRDPYTYGSNSVLTHISDVADYTAATITAADLTDVTSFTGPPVVTQGWKLGLKASGDWTGEKALASSVTVNGEVLFTTHEPPHTASADGCVVSVGTARR